MPDGTPEETERLRAAPQEHAEAENDRAARERAAAAALDALLKSRQERGE